MFLFTTPAPAPANAPASQPTAAATPVVDAIRQGAARSGTSFDYLLATAQRESALDPSAKAGTSSASGLFQFIEQTWLGLVKSDGAGAGLGDLADAITTRQDGSLAVSDPGTKQAILKLREDPQLSAAFAGTLTQKNRASLAAETGRDPSAGDLYAAHVLGARGAADLINTAASAPGRVAALDFPDAAAANRGLFYDRTGRPRGAAEVYAVLTASHAGVQAAASGGDATPASAMATQTGPALHGLFQTGGRQGPISDAVARIWRTHNGAGASTGPAVSYFPRERSATADAGETPAPVEPVRTASAAPAELAGVGDAARPMPSPSIPLPPIRPRFASDPTPNSLPGSGNFLASATKDRRP